MMRGNRKKLQLLGAFAALFSLALAVGCKGFFQNPTLTTITIGPATPSIQQGTTLQMTAVGTYSDGSTNTLTKGVFWSSDTTSVATISSTGLVSAVSSGTSTITASASAVSATTSVTVVLGNVTAITVSPSNTSVLIGGTVPFTAKATISGGTTADITGTATWTVTQGGVVSTTVSCSFDGVSQEDCTADSTASTGAYTITVTYGGTSVFGTATLNVD